MNTIAVLPAFAAADERAFDRAVRRLPGFWTWDYVADVAGTGTVTAVISPPWDPSKEAFHVFCRPGEPFGLESGLDNRASGEYPDLDHLLRGIRAVVMGDPFDRKEHAPLVEAERPPRKTAKGRPIVPNGREVTADDLRIIEDTLAAWTDAGFCPLSCDGSTLFVDWDLRSPAFILGRTETSVYLEDNLTVNQWSNATGEFSSFPAALEAVRCVICGVFSSAMPEVEQFFEVRRTARLRLTMEAAD